MAFINFAIIGSFKNSFQRVLSILFMVVVEVAAIMKSGKVAVWL
jgi:hypothetical protein